MSEHWPPESTVCVKQARTCTVCIMKQLTCCALPQFEVEAGDLAAVRALEARRRDALGEPPPYDNAHTLLLKYRCDPEL